MSQELILEADQKPDINFIQAKNRPIADEPVNDYTWKDPATQNEYKIKLPYWVWFAIQRHYVVPGFSLSDYFWGAINGFKGDEKDDIKRAGFNLIAVANEMGVGKSCLSLQLAGTVYGNEHAGKWEPDWDMVLKYTILARSRIIPLWKEGKEKGRMKLTLLDDLDSIFSKELWFEDRPLYIKLRKAINLMRPRLSNMLVSAPSLNDVISILNSKITFEVMPFPDQTYMVERYCRFVDQFSSTSNFFRKIMTEFSKFRLKNLPSDVYQQYDGMRAEKEEDEMAALEEAMIESEKKKEIKKSFNEPRKDKQPPTRYLAKCNVCGWEWWTFAKPRQCNKCQGPITLASYG